ncbi:MAG: mannose-1-phosphate guanylyltransferase, partial [Acidobacteria bacterium]|nr:mannose-1-phosphate guanylyltransferase [Acidobacteriota bacterium]
MPSCANPAASKAGDESMQVFAVVMAGGRGERFWPLSTEELPKPFIPLLGGRTLLQDTVERLQPLAPAERTLVSLGEHHLEVARRQLPGLPERNFIVEPVGRDTAACIGYCALHIERRDPEGAMLAVPADHYISDPEAFRETLAQGIRSLPGATGVVFGIAPERPETGYGYIQAEKPATPGQAWPVLRFVEKPDAETATRYVAAGNYFWNSGMFLWSNRILLELFREHMPGTYRGLDRLRGLLDRPEERDRRLAVFSAFERISIDYGIAEKASGLRLVPVGFVWDDVGNWSAIERALRTGDTDNTSLGPSC